MGQSAKSSVLIFFLIGTLDVAFAGLGRQVPVQSVYQQLCLLEYGEVGSNLIYEEVCSGVLIAPKMILTAAHCVQNKLPRRVQCGPARYSSPVLASENSKTDSHPGFNDLFMAGTRSILIWDAAVLHLNEEIPGREVPFMSLDDVTSQSKCAFFGFSHLLGKAVLEPNEKLVLKGWEVPPNAISRVDDHPVVGVAGLIGPGSFVEPGDSGGALMCQSSDKSWALLGITSGYDMNYNSLFTESMAIFDWLKPIKAFTGAAVQQAEMTLGLIGLRDVKEEFFSLKDRVEKILLSLQTDFPPLSVFDHQASRLTKREAQQARNLENLLKLTEQWSRLNSTFEKETQKWLITQKGFSLRLKPYSIIFVPKMTSEPVSIFDRHRNYFVYKSGPNAQGYINGDLTFLDYSDNFIHPVKEFRMGSRVFKDVFIRIEDLQIELFKLKN